MTETGDNVPSFGKRSKTRKVKPLDQNQQLANIIMGRLCTPKNCFPVQYHSVEVVPGKHQALRDDGTGLVTPVCQGAVADELLRYVQHRPEFALRDRGAAMKVVEMWAAYASDKAVAIPMPPPFRWADEPGLTFHRIPWTPTEGPTPTWDEVMGRMTNSAAYMAWLGSLFFPESYKQQYVWVYGEGGDGKGAMAEFLKFVFGKACRAGTKPVGDSARFWTHGLIGKRLVIFTEIEDPYFVTQAFFKGLTGDSGLVSIEEKGRPSYDASLDAKYLFFSNTKPAISSQHSDGRRLIYCEIKRFEGKVDTAYGTRLQTEGGAFLAKCISAYKRAHNGNGVIDNIDDLTKDLADEAESSYLGILKAYFEIDAQRNQPSRWVTGDEISKILRDEQYKYAEINEFKSYISRKGHERNTWAGRPDKSYAGLIARSEKLVIVKKPATIVLHKTWSPTDG